MLTECISLTGLILLLWLVFEPLYAWKGRGRPGWKIFGWLLRPWGVWAIVNLVYRLNPAGRFDHIKTAPDFFKEIYPLFASFWRPEEVFSETVARLVRTPPVYIWSAVVVLLMVLLVYRIRVMLAGESVSRRRSLGLLLGLYLLGSLLHLSIASLPDGAWSTEARTGSLLSCWKAHTTMLYTVNHVESKSHFLRNFHEIHPDLRYTIHGMSHPPGATLSMYWLGQAMGAKGLNVRLDRTRIRYGLGLVLFGNLSVFILFFLGRNLFGTNRHGLVAALLWITAPTVMIHSNWTQDILYAVFFNLALWFTWRVGTDKTPPYGVMAVLGLVWFCLVFMNYSWCLSTLIFALFLLYRWRSERWSFKEAFLRGVPPLALMTVLGSIVLLRYDLNYLKMYEVSSHYVKQWYHFETLYHHLIAWAGGQAELWVQMGAVAVSAFFVSFLGARRKTHPPAVQVFMALILVVFLIPILFGPTPLRMETARCWLWILSVPLCYAAYEMLAQSRPRLYITAAVASSILIYTVMRLFLNYSG